MPEIFNRESFELCARSNLTYVLEILERVDAEPGSLRRVKLENAAATVRELLNPQGSYFERSETA